MMVHNLKEIKKKKEPTTKRKLLTATFQKKMTFEHTKIYSILLIKEMQVKTTLRYLYQIGKSPKYCQHILLARLSENKHTCLASEQESGTILTKLHMYSLAQAFYFENLF
jgi:hypothetical protein